jgi:hypothetical protein
MFDFLFNLVAAIHLSSMSNQQDNNAMKPTSLADFSKPCQKCGGLYMCCHKRSQSFDSTNHNAPEVVEEVASDIGSPNNAERIRVATQENSTPKRTLIRPPPDVVLDKEPDTTIISRGGVLSTVNGFPIQRPKAPLSDYAKGHQRIFGDSSKPATAKDWLVCNVCNKNINVHYFDEHIKVHTAEYATPSLVNGITGAHVSTQIPSSTAIVPSNKASSSSEPKKPVFPKINDPEIYRFRKIEKAVSHASTSISKRYSDYTLVFILENKPNAYSSSYATGTSSSLYRDFERLIVHIVHDSVDDYYLVSTKILKRSAHSSWDTEEAPIPERFCYQEELLTEIRRAILYMGVDPKSAYIHYRRMLRDEIVSEADDRGRVLVAKTRGFADFIESMKKGGSNAHGYNSQSDMAYCG